MEVVWGQPDMIRLIPIIECCDKIKSVTTLLRLPSSVSLQASLGPVQQMPRNGRFAEPFSEEKPTATPKCRTPVFHGTMTRHRSLRILLLILLLPLSFTLKFDLAAHTGHNAKNNRCIRNFVAKDTLVLVTAIVDGHKGDGQIVNMHIKDAVGNDYGRAKDIGAEEKRMAFTSHADAAFDVCFENQLVASREQISFYPE